jgi:hypothetical protein
MNQQNKIADITNAVNVFTKTLLWKLTEGHPVEQEEIDALNEMREEAGMKPLNIAVPSQQSEKKAPRPEGKAPQPADDPEYNPQAIVINGQRFEGQLLPDNKQWTNRFYIKSESSGRLYTIAQNKKWRYWGCNCPGWIGHRKCKHLEALGLPAKEQPYEAKLKAASTKTGVTIKFADDGYSPEAYKLAAELIHSDQELSKMMEPIENAYGEAHIDGPEAGASNDELHANTHEENGVPVADGGIKSPERQNVNAIREAIETQAEMEVHKPIEVKQEQVERAVEQTEAKLNGEAPAGATEVSAKPGTQIIINVGSKTAVSQAERLMLLENDVWDRLGIESGGQIMEDPQLEARYQAAMLAAMKTAGFKRISQAVIDQLENENYHQLVKLLTSLKPINPQQKFVDIRDKLGIGTGGQQYPNDPSPDYAERVRKLEEEGLTTSDAQAVVEAEIAKEKKGAESTKTANLRVLERQGKRVQVHDIGELAAASENSEEFDYNQAENVWVDQSGGIWREIGDASEVKQGAEPIGGENQGKVTSGMGTGAFGGTDLEGPSFHVGFVFRGTRREASFSSFKEAHAFIKSASAKFSKFASNWTMRCPWCGKMTSKGKPEDSYACSCGWNSHTAVSETPIPPEKPPVKKTAAADPAKRNLVLEILGHGPKTTDEIEKALGGGKYTNMAYPVLQDLLREGLLKHKQMRWHLKTAVRTKTAAWVEWRSYVNSPVEVVTRSKGREVFPNLAEAQKKYPTIDPEHNGQDFTWAVRGQVDGKPAMRFDDWETERIVSASKKASFGKRALSIESRVSEKNKTDVIKAVTDRLNGIFADLKKRNPQGYMDSFEQQLTTFMMDTAEALGLQMDYAPESDTYVFYDQAGAGTRGKKFEELQQQSGESEHPERFCYKCGEELLPGTELEEGRGLCNECISMKTSASSGKTADDPQGISEEHWSNWETGQLDMWLDNESRETFELKQDMVRRAIKEGLTPEQLAEQLKKTFRKQYEELKRESGFEGNEPWEEPNWVELAKANMDYERRETDIQDSAFMKSVGISSSLKNAAIHVTSVKRMPQKGTPEWHQLQIAVQTMKMPDPMVNVMGGPDREESEQILAQYGLRWDEKAYTAGGTGVKKAAQKGWGHSKLITQMKKLLRANGWKQENVDGSLYMFFFHPTNRKIKIELVTEDTQDSEGAREPKGSWTLFKKIKCDAPDTSDCWESYRRGTKKDFSKVVNVGVKKAAEDLTYQANADGYMLYYKGKPIGGAGVNLPRENPLRGNQGRENLKMFGQNARDAIAALKSGRGEKRFLDAMAQIDAGKTAGDGMAKTEEQVEKEAGFNFFFPGQVVKEFYPEIQHEIVDYPNATNQPMSGAGNPEIVGDDSHELEGMLDEALDTNVIEMIQLPADVGEVEPLAMAAADYSSTKPAGGMGIGRDGKPEVLEGAPLRKENDIRGYMFTDEFYGQYEGIPGAAMAIASQKVAAGDEVKQFSEFLKKVCGEIAATFVASFKITQRPLLDKVPGVGEIQLDIIEQGQQTQPLGVTGKGGRVAWLMKKLNDGDIKSALNSSWAQAAVWNDDPNGGFVYEVFVRPETIDTDSLIMKYRFVCGTRE